MRDGNDADSFIGEETEKQGIRKALDANLAKRAEYLSEGSRVCRNETHGNIHRGNEPVAESS